MEYASRRKRNRLRRQCELHDAGRKSDPVREMDREHLHGHLRRSVRDVAESGVHSGDLRIHLRDARDHDENRLHPLRVVYGSRRNRYAYHRVERGGHCRQSDPVREVDSEQRHCLPGATLLAERERQRLYAQRDGIPFGNHRSDGDRDGQVLHGLRREYGVREPRGERDHRGGRESRAETVL